MRRCWRPEDAAKKGDPDWKHVNRAGLIAGWKGPFDKGRQEQSPVQVMLLKIPEADHGLQQHPFSSAANYFKTELVSLSEDLMAGR